MATHPGRIACDAGCRLWCRVPFGNSDSDSGSGLVVVSMIRVI